MGRGKSGIPTPVQQTATQKASPEVRDARRARALRRDAARWHGATALTEHDALAVLHAIEGFGEEIVRAGTRACLEALTVQCPDCWGSGEGGDSDVGPPPRCEPCGGWGRVPRKPEDVGR